MELNTQVAIETQDFARTFFNSDNLVKGKRILDHARISISFQKGSPERFFIISALIDDNNTNETKITFKKNEDHPAGQVVSKCNCHFWDDEFHCPHAVALFFKFLINHKVKNDTKDSNGIINPSVTLHGHGVHANHYSRLVNSAPALNGARMNSTYSSLQYILTNHKLINFPIAQDFTEKIIINFIDADTLEDYKSFPNIENKFFPTFYLKSEDCVTKKISLFESLYLFNWENGDLFNTPSNLKPFLKNIKNEGPLKVINDYLRLITPLFDSDNLEIQIRGKALKDYNFENAKTRFEIIPSSRRGYLELELEIFNQELKRISPPEIFKIITSTNGLLSSFRTKNDSYAFLKALVDSIEFESTEFRKYLYSSSKKEQLQKLVEYIFDSNTIYFMDPHYEQIYYFDNEFVKNLIHSLFTFFQETATRFSYFEQDNKTIYFQVPKNQLLNGITSFYKKMSLYKIEIFYNKKELKNWNSNIRFERRSNKLDWFEVDLFINENDLEIIKNAEISDNFIITNDGLILLNEKEKELLKFMKKYTNHELIGDSKVEGEGQKFALNFRRARIFELFELKRHGIEGALTKDEEILCENLISLKEMPQFELPERYQTLARDYQATGYNWLRFLYENKFGACLADDMGLGKTLQTIMFLQSIINQVEKVLIVCPVSILINWHNEFTKFSDLDIEVYYGDNRNLDHSKKIILTSYGVMKKESYTTFKGIDLDILIMDEVQHLKNIRSQGAIAARNLNANFRICLTGTPVENDLSEFYNIMDLSIPGIWGELSFLKTTSTKKSRLLARKTVRPFILRRTKEQVLKELPDKVENHVFLNFNEEERSNYIENLAQIRQRMQSIQRGRKYGEVLKGLLQLRQLCLWQREKYLQSTKIDFLMENLEQIIEEGHKTIVFSQFTTYLDIIQDKIRERGWKFVRIDGSISFKKRAEYVEEFQKGDSQIFLISLKAGGVGLNLTAASYIFLMDPWWNPAVENQAIDRAHRIGQENKLTVYRPIIKDSVEEKVLLLQNTKKELFKDLMASDDDTFYNGKLSMDDFESLLT